MSPQTKATLGSVISLIIVYYLTITLSTHNLLGITFGAILYIGIQIEAKVQHIMRQKGWYD